MSDGSQSYHFNLYNYTPSLAAAVIFIILFVLTTAAHTYQTIRTRTRFYIALLIGGNFEWIGYVGRAISSNQAPHFTTGPYVLQSVLLLVAPALFAATVYMTLGRVAKLCGAEEHLLIPARWLTKLFVIGDILSFLVQAGGAGFMAAGTLSGLQTGQKIVLAGLFLQIFYFCIFVFVGVRFHRRLNEDHRKMVSNADMPWQKHMFALYAASGLILVRSVYRIIEYFQGFNGYTMSHEWFLYVFDGLLMLTVMVIFNFVHGGELNLMLKEKNALGRQEAMTRLSRSSRS